MSTSGKIDDAIGFALVVDLPAGACPFRPDSRPDLYVYGGANEVPVEIGNRLVACYDIGVLLIGFASGGCQSCVSS
jgi:hypothetical protein